MIRYPFSEAHAEMLQVLERIASSLSDSLAARYVAPASDKMKTIDESVEKKASNAKTESVALDKLNQQLQHHKHKLTVIHHNIAGKRLQVKRARVVFWVLIALLCAYALSLFVIPSIIHIAIALALLLFISISGLRGFLDDKVASS